MGEEKPVSRDLNDDPYQMSVSSPQILGGVSWQSILEHEAWEAKFRAMAEQLNGEARQRELQAQDLCDKVYHFWRQHGSDNVSFIIPGQSSVESLIRARELFLKLPDNLNIGDVPKVDFYMLMGRRNGNPYIILCAPGTVV